MSTVFGILAFAALIAFIIGMIKPKIVVFWSKKKKRTLALLYLPACFIFICIASVLDTSPESANTTANPATSSVSKALVSSQISSTTTSSTVEKQAVSQKTSSTNSKNSIKGSSATDVKLNLKKWGLTDVKTSNNPSNDGFCYDCTNTDSDTGAELHYFITAESDFTIDAVTFSVTNLNNTDKNTFLEVADGFLAYGATIPYDTAQPKKAQKWVTDNISAADKNGKVISSTIGDAQFSLYGNGSKTRFLEIKKVK